MCMLDVWYVLEDEYSETRGRHWILLDNSVLT